MYPRLPAHPMMYGGFGLGFAIVSWICALIMLAGFVFFLVTAWRYMRAHEQLSNAVKEIVSLKAQSKAWA